MNPEEKSICACCNNVVEKDWFINYLFVYDCEMNHMGSYKICNSCLHEKLGRLKYEEEIEGE